MTHEQLLLMSEEVGSHRTLLICCAAFDTNVLVSITVKCFIIYIKDSKRNMTL